MSHSKSLGTAPEDSKPTKIWDTNDIKDMKYKKKLKIWNTKIKEKKNRQQTITIKVLILKKCLLRNVFNTSIGHTALTLRGENNFRRNEIIWSAEKKGEGRIRTRDHWSDRISGTSNQAGKRYFEKNCMVPGPLGTIPLMQSDGCLHVLCKKHKRKGIT